MTVLSTFLKSSLNFLLNNQKITKKFDADREKSGIKVCTARNAV